MASRARCAIRSRPRISARTLASTAASRSSAATALGARPIYGPHSVDAGRASVMRSATQFQSTESAHVRQSELCATCHTLYTTTLDERGEATGELPEQVPYQEWRHSEFRETRSCQDCHMPKVGEDGPIASIFGVPRPPLAQHTFRGGNAFILGILNKYRGELGVAALPQELDAAIRETRDYLGSAAARVAIDDAENHGQHARVRRPRRESRRPQAADRVSRAARVAACAGDGRGGRRGLRVGRAASGRLDRRQRQRRGPAEVRAAPSRDHAGRPGADLRIDHGGRAADSRPPAC